MKYLAANILAVTLLFFLAGCAGMDFEEGGYGAYPEMGYGGYGGYGGYEGMGYPGMEYGGSMGGYEGMGGDDDDEGGDDD